MFADLEQYVLLVSNMSIVLLSNMSVVLLKTKMLQPTCADMVGSTQHRNQCVLMQASFCPSLKSSDCGVCVSNEGRTRAPMYLLMSS